MNLFQPIMWQHAAENNRLNLLQALAWIAEWSKIETYTCQEMVLQVIFKG